MPIVTQPLKVTSSGVQRVTARPYARTFVCSLDIQQSPFSPRPRVSTAVESFFLPRYAAVSTMMMPSLSAPPGLGVAFTTLMMLMPPETRGHTMHTRPISRQYSRTRDFLDT